LEEGRGHLGQSLIYADELGGKSDKIIVVFVDYFN
jgi:hypothetical protein